MVGCRIANTTEILPEHQHPVVGGGIHLNADAPPLGIEIVDLHTPSCSSGHPPTPAARAGGGRPGSSLSTPAPGSSSRLLVRGRYEFGSDWKSRRAFGRFPLEAITFVMSRKIMLEIKRLAERHANQHAAMTISDNAVGFSPAPTPNTKAGRTGNGLTTSRPAPSTSASSPPSPPAPDTAQPSTGPSGAHEPVINQPMALHVGRRDLVTLNRSGRGPRHRSPRRRWAPST